MDTSNRNTTTRRRTVKKQTSSTNTNDHDRTPTEEEIRRRAYELYEQRGAEPGHDKEDWELAERELRADHS